MTDFLRGRGPMMEQSSSTVLILALSFFPITLEILHVLRDHPVLFRENLTPHSLDRC